MDAKGWLQAFHVISCAAGNISYVEHEGLKRTLLQSMADLHVLLETVRSQLEYHPTSLEDNVNFRRTSPQAQQLPPLVSVLEQTNHWMGGDSQVLPVMLNDGADQTPSPPLSPEDDSDTRSPSDDNSSYRQLTIDIPVSTCNLRKRQNIPKLQKESLEIVFQSCPYPSVKARKQLAETLQTTPRKVQIWFQNRRAKWKGTENKVNVLGHC
ncbi:Q50 paired-like homeodomain transcription factor [Planoprotostelium fungivorum]|uniref:Q50 paired-like homeodomain transcription factor n=1 Tax=Planoprotostelium fungivorum TaxID=1890364 RepID=A0A2P6N6R7_9EUKA|nr:Q50 paired-like homeodomain transcription factor [Planoprotostelium fungivorum]